MKSRWVVVALFVVLCGSACGSAQPVMRTLVSRSGSGSTTLGTFALRGEIDLSVGCTGAGRVTVDFDLPGSPGSWSICPHGNLGVMGLLAHSRRVRVTVKAPAAVDWTVTAAERPKK